MTVSQVHGVTAGVEGGPWNWPVPADPGDLSRRLTARRTELRLSVSQVAGRAGVEPRYLAYLVRLAGRAVGETFGRTAEFLTMAAAASPVTGDEGARAAILGSPAAPGQ